MARKSAGNGSLEIDGTRLTLAQIRAFERRRPAVRLTGEARARMQGSVEAVREAVAGGEVVRLLLSSTANCAS